MSFYYINEILETIPEGEKWTDPDFPPEFKSLCPEWTYESSLSKEEFEKWKTLTWRRATDIPCLQNDQGGINFSNGAFRLDDIKQGNIKDSYLMSAISTLGERAVNLFENPGISSEGVYCVILYVNGEKRKIFVDDYFPCDGY
jgi:hypothetical protein